MTDFQNNWSEGYIIPLHKKGSRSEAENYISTILLNSLGKLFTRVINNRFTD